METTIETTPDVATPPPLPAPVRHVSLARHLTRYMSANMIGIVAGVVSFPIMSRYLSKYEFGLLGLFETFALIWTAILKMGTQHSLVRFYPAYGMSRDPQVRRAYYASLLQAPALISLALFAAVLLGLLAANGVHRVPHTAYLTVVLLLGEMRVLGSLAENTIRARENSALASRVSVVQRVTQTGLVVAVVTLVAPTAMAVYLAQACCAAGLLAFYYDWSRTHCEFGLRSFSRAIFREGMAYGLPLVWSEISYILLAFADRLMMVPLGCNLEQVGIYSVGYGLAMIAGDFIMFSLLPAFQPMANRLYETQGLAAALRLQRQLLRMLYYMVAAVATGLALVGHDFLVLWAGPEKAAAAPVFQWIGINYVIFPIFGVMAYGLNLTKRTKVIAVVVLWSAGLNVVLNFVMIPWLGIMGAVYATLISYVVMGSAQIACCPRDHLPTPAWGDLARPTALAALMAATALGTGMLGTHKPVARLAAAAAIFATTFVLPMLTLDREIRTMILGRIRKRGVRSAERGE